MEENMLQNFSLKSNCKLCCKTTCSCQIDKKCLATLQTSDGSIIITEEFITDLLSQKLFKENVHMPLKNQVCDKIIKNPKWLENDLLSQKSLSMILSKNEYLLEILRTYQSKISSQKGLKLIYDEQYFPVLKTFYSMFLKQLNPMPKNMISWCQVDNVEQESRLKTTNSKAIITSQDVNKRKMLNLFQCYFSLLDKNHHLENVNTSLFQKIKDLEMKIDNLSAENSELRICKICPKFQKELGLLKEEHNKVLKNFAAAQIEKERMVMKYVTSEKRILEVQKCVQQAEKKYQEAVKENIGLQKKLQKSHENYTKLNGEMNTKCSEITQLRHQIEHQKDSDNAKDMKLKWTQNRLKFITDAQADTQAKLTEALAKIAELTNECETMRSQKNDIIKKVQKSEENKVTVLDQQLKEQQAKLILERHMAEDSESTRAKLQRDYETLLNRQRIADKENHLLISQISTLQKECMDYKTKLNAVSLSYDKEKEEVQTLRNELAQMETLNKQLDSNVRRIGVMEIELARLSEEKADFQADIESYRQREVQMLEFTQKLTDKNVQIQSEYTNLQSKYHVLENNQQPLHKTIEKFTSDLKNLEQNLSFEKSKRTQECELLAKCIAEQTFYNQRLLQQLEDLEGQNEILRKKYELTIREMNRELHLYHSKLKESNLDPSSSKSLTSVTHSNGSLSSEDTHDESTSQSERSKIYDSLLEKEKLFDQIIKLQKINVKRAEKLDFLEGHSHALLEELQKKTKIIQNYREIYSKSFLEKKVNIDH